MATIKSFTSLEQSRKLAEFLPLESADMFYGYIAPYEFSDRSYEGGYDNIPYPKDFMKKNPNFSEDEYDGEFPCWSLAALIKALPRSVEYKGDAYYLGLLKDYVEYANNKISLTGIFLHTTGNDNLVDACVEIIEKLHEQKLL